MLFYLSFYADLLLEFQRDDRSEAIQVPLQFPITTEAQLNVHKICSFTTEFLWPITENLLLTVAWRALKLQTSREECSDP